MIHADGRRVIEIDSHNGKGDAARYVHAVTLHTTGTGVGWLRKTTWITGKVVEDERLCLGVYDAEVIFRTLQADQ